MESVAAALRRPASRPQVICLQEVSRNWGGDLVEFFEEHGYAHSMALSGSAFSGYMGQCVAWPRDKYSVAEVSNQKLSDTVAWPKAPRSKKPSPDGAVAEARAALARARARAAQSLALFGLQPIKNKSKEPFDPRAVALKRHNCVVMVLSLLLPASAAVLSCLPRPATPWCSACARVRGCLRAHVGGVRACVLRGGAHGGRVAGWAQVRLQERESGKRFCVATYHMPCLFGSDIKCQVTGRAQTRGALGPPPTTHTHTPPIARHGHADRYHPQQLSPAVRGAAQLVHAARKLYATGSNCRAVA